MKVDIVGISSKQGGGKSTASMAIKAAIELRGDSSWAFQELTFAGGVYAVHDFYRKMLVDAGIEIPENLKVKDGEFLQELGTKHGRMKYGEDVWIRLMRKKIDNEKLYAEVCGFRRLTIVMPDLRFKNEFHSIADGLRVRLECPEHVRKDRCLKNSNWRENTQHPSETDLDDYAREGRFDLLLDSDIVSPGSIADKVITELLHNDWRLRRHGF